MTKQIRPAVRVVLGFAGTAQNPPSDITSEATLALRQAVAALGRDWQRHAESFAIFPAARSGRVVVGVASTRAPQHFDQPRTIQPNAAISATHYVTPSGPGHAAEVDRRGEQLATDGILRALEACAVHPAIAALGLQLDENDGEFRRYVLSDDGREGALVFGQALWKRGDAYAGGAVQTWAHEYEDGEGVRLVGVAIAKVDGDTPLVELPFDVLSGDFEAEARPQVKAVLDTSAPFGWYLRAAPAP